MKTLSPDAAIIAMQLQQLLMQFAHELDTNDGREIAHFYADDGRYLVGNCVYEGQDEITKFYNDRAIRVAREEPEGVRTGRHTYVNPHVSVGEDDNATIYFICVYFSAGGKAPILDCTGPTVIADCAMDFRRDSAGNWKIKEFRSMPVFLGNDTFVNSIVSKN